MPCLKLMNAIKLIALTIVTSFFFSTAASAKEVHVWDKTPIEIKLKVDEERIIHFPSNIKLGMTPAFKNLISTSNAAGTLYIKANNEFGKNRVFATLDNGEKLILDFFAVGDTSGEKLEDFEIIHPKAVKNKTIEFNKGSAPSKTSNRASNNVTIKQLLQYVTIDLYGPSRLLPNLAITTSKIKTKLNLDHVFINRSAGLFDLHAYKEYRSFNYTITAIQLRNRTPHAQYVVLTDVYPAMIANSSYETYVGPRSDDADSRDTTTFFIVTKKPLKEYDFYAMKKVIEQEGEKDE